MPDRPGTYPVVDDFTGDIFDLATINVAGEPIATPDFAPPLDPDLPVWTGAMDLDVDHQYRLNIRRGEGRWEWTMNDRACLAGTAPHGPRLDVNETLGNEGRSIVGGVSSTSHWEAIYRGRATEDLGWYEPRPSTLDLVLGFSDPADAVIDIGAGDSRLADELLDAGYQHITVLDLSETALDRARSRLRSAAEAVNWICADVTRWTPPRRWDFWHDRAVFHFLIDEEDQKAYKAAAVQAMPVGGKLVVATFAPDGPEQCAGLPVQRYDADELAAVFAPEFRLLEHQHLPANPASLGDSRPYVAVVLERS